ELDSALTQPIIISGRTRASAAVQGDRPTVRPKQVLAESRGYPPRVISGRREYFRSPQIPRNLKSEIPFFSPLFFEQLIELALLVFVEDAQDSSLAIAEHVAVIDSEIVEDDGHFLGLFGGQAQILLPALEPYFPATLGIELRRAMHPLVSAQVHGYHTGYARGQ